MRKIQLGCGSNRLAGWENYDMEVDITKKLPFNDNTISAILAEHVVEHITIHQAWNFFEDCYTILEKGGKMRIAVPSVSQIYENATQNYLEFIKKNGWGENTLKDAVKSIIFNHGHQTIWEKSSLIAILSSIGFTILKNAPEEMKNTLNHSSVIGEDINRIETIIIDCIK